MAKDGTMRGGPRPGTGPKPKAISEKIAAGNTKFKVIDLPEGANLEGADVPEPSAYLKSQQKGGGTFEAEAIYKEVWLWLKERGCERLINKQTIEQYAMSVSRLIQCEEAISEYGFLSKHPTTNAAIASPFVSMAQNYQKQVNNLWYQIYQVVKENCAAEFSSPDCDPMELLLRAKKNK